MIAPQDQFVHDVVAAFGKAPVRGIAPLGGTACPKFAVDTPAGRFVVRVRAEEFSPEPFVRFDHEAMTRLAGAGLPVPEPQVARDGRTWVGREGRIVELLSWKDGDAYVDVDFDRIAGVGRFLGRFHAVFSEGAPEGKEGFVREDHPDMLLPIIEGLRPLAKDAAQREGLAYVESQLDRVRNELDAGLYERLPAAVIHGDIHHGNLRFEGADVSAVYDFDYMSRQARARDLCDAVMFFGSTRGEPLDFDDIRSLTQPFFPDRKRTAALLEGYQETTPLGELDLLGLRLLIRSQWVQIRLRGSRKIPAAERVAFVTDRFETVIDWLDRESEPFFAAFALGKS